MSKKIFALLSVLLMVTALTGCKKSKSAQSEKKIVAACAAEWPPLEFVNENREIVGFDIDLIKAIGEAEGYQVEVRNTAWDGLFAGIVSGEYDVIISGVTITKERKEKYNFSTPYLNAGQILVVKKGTKNIKSLKDLVGKSVGAQIGTTGALEIKKVKDVDAKLYDEVGFAIADLANGRISAVVCDYPIAADYALQNKKYKGVLEIAGEPFTGEDLGIVVAKGNDNTLKIVNSGLKKVKESGKLKELEDKWLR